MLALLLLLAPAPPVARDTTYWQQRVAYEITASLDEPSGVLSGHERIHYVNQSPDTLRDFYVHDYLNAFRPGSRWSAADSAEGRVRFQHMKDPDYAFERISQASLGKPDYPYAPDSTIAHWTLPRPLAPGDSLDLEITWTARPSTLPRRQGRQGRRFDFAQWYPKVVVYDKYGWEDHPLYPAGEFYGEFATYDVTLDLAEDQVVGATGVPVEGDPGWEKAAVGGGTIDYQRDYYGRQNTKCAAVASGRKCVRFYAEWVHHFAFSLNPDYRYEQGRYKDVAVHVLYQPGDSATWGHGIAVQRTETALVWLDSLYGKFAWPQITNVHRIEGGGTEFPMMIMAGGPGLGLIVHELGHNYTMGILANNEWREGYLDEGFTSFQTGWFFEAHGMGSEYQGIEPDILFWDLDRWSEPVSMVSERYRDFFTYNTMIYEKGQLFYEQLRYVVGDSAMREILHRYYARWRLKHVNEDAFRSVAEEVSHQDLKWLFGQWLHGTPLIDYRLTSVNRKRLPDGKWLTAVTIDRVGDGWMPMEIGDSKTIYARSTGQQERERVEFVADSKPGRLVLDPRQRAHDWNALNNRERRGLFGSRGPDVVRLDDPTKETVRRDRLVTALLPVAWYNDFGGKTIALRSRSNYLGRFEKNVLLFSGGANTNATHRLGLYARFANPVAHPIPRTETSAAFWSVEGRSGIALHADRSLVQHPFLIGTEPHAGFDAQWMAVSDFNYVDKRLWDNAGTIEAGPWVRVTSQNGGHVWKAAASVRGGLVYRNPGPGIQSSTRYDIEGYARMTGEVSLRAPFVLKSGIGLRLFAGGYFAPDPPPLQRRIMLAGADPYQTFTNPLLRSRGALLVRPGFYYQVPGDGNLRAFNPTLGGRWVVALNAEGTKTLYRRRTGIVTSIGAEVFGDVGVVDTMAVRPSGSQSATIVRDAGLGIVTQHRLNDLAWTMRFELPFYVSRWDYAADVKTFKHLAFRWQVSLEPSF